MKYLSIFASIILFSTVATAMVPATNPFDSDSDQDDVADLADVAGMLTPAEVKQKIKEILHHRPNFDMQDEFQNCMKELLDAVEKQ